MPKASIVPVAKSLYVCDGTIGFPGGKTDIMGVFNSINAAVMPHTQKHFVVYARLANGLGAVPFFVDIAYAATRQVVHTSNVNLLQFPNRDTLVELALTMTNVSFPQSGLYLIELFCNNQWVADTTLLLK